MHTQGKVRLAVVAALVAAGLVATAGPPAGAAAGHPCTVVGTPGDDVLRGTSGDDVICGRGGDDKITGLGGDDVLRGGAGDDVLRGGAGDDRVLGGAGDDGVFGQGGDDVLRGDADDDDVTGGGGDDRIGGSQGDDTLRSLDGTKSNDRVRCGDGDDRTLADADDVVRGDCEDVDQNDPPTDITLLPAFVFENEFIGTDVGELVADDPDEGDEVTFSLVGGAGSDDNELFGIDGDTLETAVELDFEADNRLTVRVRATDDGGEFVETALRIDVRNANDPPVAGDDEISGQQGEFIDAATDSYYGLLANDTDQEDDPLSIVGVGGAVGGDVQLLSDVVRFYPAEGACGDAAGSYTYTVSDDHGGTDTATVTVNIFCGT